MDMKLLELTVDLTKTTIEHSSGGLIVAPDTITKFMDEIARKVDELYRKY
ncbi:MAG: hypothetical protein ACRD5R_12800 [Candidatus Acidiferrales bacterium]